MPSLSLVRSHGTTLVFVNTRRLVERVARQLTERLGEDAVVAHHGSLARATRFAAEEKLKHGEVKVCVTTASLELGIDIGVVDLVCQIGSPTVHRNPPAAHRTLGTHPWGRSQGPPVSPDPGRACGVRRPVQGYQEARSWTPSRFPSGPWMCWPSR